LSLTAGGVAHDDAPACSPEDVAFGPVSAGLLQPSGLSYGCRIGPSPEGVFRHEVRENTRLASCLRGAGPGVVEATVVVEPNGHVSSVTITRLEGDSVAFRACLAPIARLRFKGFGCRWSQILRWIGAE
jgi:hypothetical protein